MDICCISTFRQRKQKAKNSDFGAVSTLTRERLPACKSAIGTCSVTAGRLRLALRSRNAVIEVKSYTRILSFLTPILCSLRDCLLSLSITTATQNSSWADDLS